jgi:threonine aldolase
MTERAVNLSSDNVSDALPEVWEAVREAMAAPENPYGADPWTEGVTAGLSEVFEREVKAFPVATGTVANCLALATITPPYGRIFCHEAAHIEAAEGAAPEFYTGGAKLTFVAGQHGKYTAEALHSRIVGNGREPSVHNGKQAVVSITQATEAGTTYSLDEIGAITEVARARGLKVHMDGARFANALVALGCTPAEMTWKAGVDVLAFGVTKNGGIAAEAVVFFDPAAAADFEYRRKRGGHLFSKFRFLSAQIAGYLKNDAWLGAARDANRLAAKLADGLGAVPGVELLQPVEVNMLFLRMPGAVAKSMLDAGCRFYNWTEPSGSTGARMVCSYNLTDADIDHAVAAARAGAAKAA